MGWTFSREWDSKLALVAYLRGSGRWGSNFKIIKSTVCGSRHWYVAEKLDCGQRFIGLDLMEKSDSEWGYKDMDETVGPNYFDCPITFLDLAPNPPHEGYALEWREKVRERHARKKNPIQWASGTVVVYGGHEYRLEHEAGPRRGWVVRREKDGRVYRMNTRQLGAAQAVENFSH